MIKTISGAFERPFIKNDGQRMPHATRQGSSGTQGSLSLRELRLLVAGMVD